MTADLVPVNTPKDITALPVEERGGVIAQALFESKKWLAVAVTGTDPTPITEFRAWAATAVEMSRQRGMAEEIQMDALEMVRRADRAVGVTVRNGQDAGEIAQRGYKGPNGVTEYKRVRNGREETVQAGGRQSNDTLVSPKNFFSTGEERVDSYQMADDVTDEQFEEALTEAKAERNLTRANVVRKIKGSASNRLTRFQKAEKIREMASQGYSSRQMEGPLSTSDGTIRKIARAHGIEIPADRVTARTKRIDPERVMQEAITTLQGVEYGLGLLSQADYDAFTPEQVRAWLGALSTPYRAIRGLMKELNNRV